MILQQIALAAIMLFVLVSCEVDVGANSKLLPSVEQSRPSSPAIRRCLEDRPLIEAAARESLGVTYTAALMAQARQESGCNPYAASRYAVGYMQFTPATGAGKIATVCRWYGQPVTKAGRKRLMRRKDWSIRCGARYMAQLRKQTSPLFISGREQYAAALAAYNGGLGWIKRERRISPAKNRYFGGVDQVCKRAAWACRENHAYPRRILDHWMPKFDAAGVPGNRGLRA